MPSLNWYWEPDMQKKWIFQILVGLLFVSFLVGKAYAQGGDKKPAIEVQEPAPAVDSPYAVDGDSAESSQSEEDGFSLSRSDIFADEPPVTPEGMEHMDHQPSGAMDDKMPHIEIAKREWVSPKQKGYGAAVGITIFAVLIFGVLSFKRPLE